jgi:hypothetical protein
VDILNTQEIAASTADDDSRAFNIDWTVDSRGVAGCHRITLRVTHRSNLDIRNPNVVDKADLAEAYWWVNIDTDPTLANTLLNCPQASRGTQ